MNDKRKSENSSDSLEIQIARLEFIGASIVTLGDAIETIAAGLALDALLRSSNQNSANSDEQSKHSSKMQREIDYIINELKEVKRMMK
ncbi:translation initiation factor 2 [Lysinibacillus sp. 3P01SB]|uniref:translation initiation factor 2 n=1 Tax=Lysinibacillus sp. 3P01SB TaxID=3132284 RepID=UPI0039A6C22D